MLSDTDPIADARGSRKPWNGLLFTLSGLSTGVPASFDITSTRATAGLKEESAARKLDVVRLTGLRDDAKAAHTAAKQSVDARTENLQREVHSHNIVLFLSLFSTTPSSNTQILTAATTGTANPHDPNSCRESS